MVKNNINITEAELPIMKVLWERDGATSHEILECLTGNKSTLKTLLLRLVQKGAVKTEEITSRTNRYFAAVSEKEYLKQTSQTFLQKAFDGSAQKMLLNFVREEQITKEDLRRLIDLIEEE